MSDALSDLNTLINKVASGSDINGKIDNPERFGGTINIDPDMTLFEIIGTAIREIEDMHDYLKIEKGEWEEKANEFENELKENKEKLEKAEYTVNATMTTEIMDTMIGTLTYKTSNAVDAELMDLFTQCLIEIQPAAMRDNLKTILAFKIVF